MATHTNTAAVKPLDDPSDDTSDVTDDTSAKEQKKRHVKERAAVARYLDALVEPTKKGRPFDTEARQEELDEISKKIASFTPQTSSIDRLRTVQRRIDVSRALDQMLSESDLNEAEKDFVLMAKSYADRVGISYLAWREVGVSAKVLREAGITRSSN